MDATPIDKSLNGAGNGPAPDTDLQRQIADIPAGPEWGVAAVDAVLACGDGLGCSDLHVASLQGRITVRGRVHGGLVPLASINSDQRELMIARLKILARLPAFLKYEPQDGRMEFQRRDGSMCLLRLSFLPTIHGENIVIRYPSESKEHTRNLNQLGMSEETFKAIRNMLFRQEGAVLLTGPSSSGKTTTMYAMLRWLNDHHGDRMNILTIEDPVERSLDFASQVQVNAEQGLTFERALRSALRQDPNVLMLGEIRDTETARATMQAGMSGHLVISTIHAGRASRVFSRLLSMSIDPVLVASAVSGAIAQRLARTKCRECSGSGCVACGLSGCDGRIGLFECCSVTENLRELILASAPPGQVAGAAAETHTSDLRAEAQRYVAEGLITTAEMEFIFAGEETDQ